MKAATPLQLLLVEDDPGDAHIVERHVAAEFGVQAAIHQEPTLARGLSWLAAHAADALILDLHLPDSQGLETLRRARRSFPELPILVLTSHEDDPIVVGVLAEGAQDYVAKADLRPSLLRRAIRYTTERVRIEQENARLRERVAAAARHESLGLLAGGIAHEFNNALHVVLNQARLIASQTPAQRGIQEIAFAAESASRLSKQLMAYAGGNRLSTHPVDVRASLDALQAGLRSLVSSSTKLLFVCDEERLLAHADEAALHQIVVALVGNATEAIGEGGGEIRLRVGSTSIDAPEELPLAPGSSLTPGRYVAVEVRDTGGGMDASTAARAFEPFFSTKFTGRGLGLSSAIGLLTAQGGGMALTTGLGEGATFSAYLPAAEEAPPGLPPPSGRAASREGLILVVDDDPDVAEVTGEVLRRQGFSCEICRSGEAAIAVLARRSDEVVLVVLDVLMPGLDGYETLARIREMGLSMPILLASGYDRAKGSGESSSSGFLTKPYQPEELIAKVDALLPSDEGNRPGM